MAQAVPIEPGTQVGHLRIERELGQGAFGTVYVARDTLIDRVVALKVLRPPGRPLRTDEWDRFRAEARIVGGFKSPNIATLYHVHRLPDGGWMLEMEYVDGGSLEDLLGSDVRLPVEAAVRIARGVARGLAAAHEAGVIHGDVKPANVLLERDGTVKVVDFGLARALSEPHASASAYAGGIAGTPHYMAPEVIMGEGHVLASDVWSVGVLLHRMVCGRLPFDAGDLNGLFHAVHNAAPPPLPPEAPPALARLVERCLAKHAQDRPPSCAEVLEDLDRLLSPGPPAQTPPRAPIGSSVGPGLHGRAAELSRVREAIAAAAAGRGAVLLVTGPAGAGKTSLLRAAGELARGAGFRWIEAAVGSVDGLLRPLLRAAREALGASDDPASLAARLTPAAFGSAAPILRDLLAEGAKVAVESRGQTLWAVERLLQGLAVERPLALAIEEGHHADAEEIALLKDLARRLSRSRALIAVECRTRSPGTVAGDSGHVAHLAEVEGAVHVDLGPLAPEAIYRLVEERARGARVPPEIAERIVHRADGNPLFAVEMLRHLEETGAVVRAADRLVPGPTWGDDSVPRRLHDLVTRRLEDLPEATRTLLDTAAVDGLEFDGQAVAALLEQRPIDVLRALQRVFREHGLVVPRPQGFRFAHPLVQEVIYEEVAPDLRREVHRRLAEHLEARGSYVDPERLGHHWEQAGLRDHAAPHLLRAADAAAGAQRHARTISLCARAGLSPRAISPSAARTHAETLFRLANSLATTGRRHDAEAVYEAVETAAGGDEHLRLRAIVRRAQARVFGEGVAPGLEADLLRAAEVLPPSFELGRARYVLGVIEKYRGNLEAASRWLRSADDVFSSLGLLSQHASALDQLASVALRRGREGDAEVLYADAARISARAGDLVKSAASEVNRAYAAFVRGDVEDQVPALEEAVRTLALEGARDLAAQASVTLAGARYAAGDLGGARRTAEEAVATLVRTGYLPGIVPAQQELGHLRAVAGDLDGALASLSASRVAAERQGDAGSLARTWAFEAQTRCFVGDPAGAADAARRAVALAGGAAEPRLRTDVALLVAEARLYGLPRDVLGASPLQEGVPADPGSADPAAIGRAVWEAARAMDSGGPAAPLQTAADALRAPGVGQRRAALRALAGRLAAESRLREGDRAGARREALAALRAAAALGHVWLELSLLRFLVALAPEGPHGRDARARARGIADRLSSQADREACLRAWAVP